MTEEADIKDITTYVPDKVSTEVLKDDWRIVMAWWAQIMAGREFTYSREQVIDLASLIYEEMKKRGLEFHPDKMTPSSRKLYEIVSKKKIEDGIEEKPNIDALIDAALRDLPGLILVKPHGTMLAAGEKTLLVKSVPFDIEGKEFYIVQEDEVLGIIEFDKMREITIEDFKKLKDGHKITEAERAEWWPEADKLYLYQISAMNKFPEPMKIDRPKGSQTFIKKVKFAEDQKLANIIRSGERMGPKLKLDDILKHFESFYINRPFITLVGGLANHPTEGTTGDIDLLIRAKKPTGSEYLPLVFRLYRMFPKELWPRIQLLWNNPDFDGPFTNYVNIYDQKIEKRPDSKKIVLMSEGKTIEEISNYPELSEDADVPDEATDALRTKKETLLGEAKTSAESGVVPFRFFEMLKGRAGYRKQETYTIESTINSIPPKDYPVEVDEKYDGMRCITGNTKIATNHGYRSAYNLKVGDIIITHTGNKLPISAINKRTIRKGERLFRLHPWLFTESRISEGHPILTKDGWKRIEDLSKDDLLFLPRPTPAQQIHQIILRTTDGYTKEIKDKLSFYRILGFWVGDGHERNNKHCKRIEWYIHDKEQLRKYQTLIEKVFNIKTKVYSKHVLVFRDAGFLELLQSRFREKPSHKLSRGTTRKVMSHEMWGLTKEEFLSLLQGWNDADGHSRNNNKSTRITTKEPQLAQYLFEMGRIHGINIGGRPTRVKGRTYFDIPVQLDSSQEKITEDHVKIFRLDEIKRPDPRTQLYDLQVNEDESFTGLGITFHNCQIHKKGDKVKVMSIDGEDLTSKLPTIVSEAKKQKDSVRDAELTGWEKRYRKGKQIGRSTVAGFIHSKEGLPHDNFFANTFDVLWIEGKDIHNSPLSERRKALETIGSTEHIKVIDMRLAKNPKELEKAIKWASAIPGSEGAMIKAWPSKYPLTGYSAKWIKYKKEADLDAEVLDVHQVAGSNTYNYLMILRNGDGTPIPVGRTYNTPIKAKKGDILRVAFGNLNMYEDPTTKKAWFNWVFPRVIEPREDKNTPDNDMTARRVHEETGGEFSSRPYPKRYKDLLRTDTINDWLEAFPDGGLEQACQIYEFTEDEIKELASTNLPLLASEKAEQNTVFDSNPYLTPADEDKDWKFMLQLHFRGKSIHGDLRNERPSFLVGWTVNLQKEGIPNKEIETLEEARRFAKDKGNIKDFRQGEPGAIQVVMQKKAPQPKQWLEAEGVYEPGEVGATKEHGGVFIKGASGTVEFLTQKPHFHEYYYHAKDGPLKDRMQGRFVARLLKNIWGPEKGGRGQFIWMGWFTKDKEPYIISSRAVKLGVMPPEGLSWLPKHIRKQIPKEFQYWKHKGKEAKEIRDDLVKAIKKEIKINFDTADNKLKPKGKFTLSHIGWRGPIVQRLGWSRQEWHLFLEDGDKVFDIIMDQDPKENVKVPAIIGSRKPLSLLKMKGPVEPKTELNPDKKTPAFIAILESGNFKVISEEPDLILLDLKGAGLRGKYRIERSNKTASLWDFSKE